MTSPESTEEPSIITGLENALHILKTEGKDAMHGQMEKALYQALLACSLDYGNADCLTAMIELAAEEGWVTYEQVSAEKVNARLEEKFQKGEIKKQEEEESLHNRILNGEQ